jgi:hypothetical protein
MWRMVRIVTEETANIVVFYIDFGGQCRLFPDDQNTKKVIALPDSVSLAN